MSFPTPLSDMVERMLSEGRPPEIIIAALRAVELSVVESTINVSKEDTTAGRRRAWDREYRRRVRESKNGCNKDCPPDFHPTKVDSYKRDCPPDFHPNPPDIHPTSGNLPSSILTYLREEKKVSKKEEDFANLNPQAESVTKIKRTGKRLPEDWAPNEKHYAAGQQIGLSQGEVDGLAEDMRLWERSNQHRQVAKKSDWDATFLGWVRREAKTMPKPPQKRFFRV